MNTPLTFGSLFAGIGGIDLGLERAGMRCAWQVEIDDYAQKILAKHWPDVARFRDVRDCGKHNLTPVDLVAGGFPCQDISAAGKRVGITGERSGLWKEFFRIICELRPRFVLVENVAALLYRGIDTVLADLASCGYDAQWQVLPAAAFGAPHIRERVFIVAYPGCDRRDGRQHEQEYPHLASQANTGTHGKEGPASDPTSNRWESRGAEQQGKICTERGDSSLADAAITRLPQWRLTGFAAHATQDATGMERQSQRCSTNVSNANRSRLAFGQVFGRDDAEELATFARDCSTGAGQWATEPGVRRVAHGVSHRVERLRGLGNAVVPQVAEYVGRCIMAAVEMEDDGRVA